MQNYLLLRLCMASLEIKIAQLPDDFPQLSQIRYQVFQLEQGVAPELEFDGKDAESTHLLAYSDGVPIGTLRLRYLDNQTVKLERLAVLPDARGQGIGKQLVVHALEHLKATNIRAVRIHAQLAVQNFYEKLGFFPEGETFQEAGIPHVKMSQLLQSPS